MRSKTELGNRIAFINNDLTIKEGITQRNFRNNKKEEKGRERCKSGIQTMRLTSKQFRWDEQ